MTIKCALVTGASGFIGSNLVKRLVMSGWETHVLIRPTSDLSLLKDIKTKIAIHSYSGNLKSLASLISEIKPSIVFHLASLFLVNHTSEDIEQLVFSNVQFPIQLVDAMATNGCSNLINTGTSWQHYDDDNYCPVNFYSATKQAFEDLLVFFIKTKKIKCITLMLFDTYGVNDNRPKLIRMLVDAAITGKPLEMSPGEQQIDLVYIDDVIDAYIVAADRLMNNKVVEHEHYAVSTGAPTSLRSLVKILYEVFGQPVKISFGARKYRDREVMKPWSGGIWLETWRPKVSLREGFQMIKESINYE